MTGRTISHYQILEKLGEGGMGEVWKARDTRLNRLVAIKALPPDKTADSDRKARFVQEARAASALNHPNIVTIHDILSEDGHDFIVMEFVAGKTLAAKIAARELRLVDALKYGVQIAGALAQAHAGGIIHRDLKPGNIMVDEHGLVKVLDFGLAKLTDTVPPGEDQSTVTLAAATEEGAVLGTPAYMSPEQACGKQVDSRTDVWAFGCTLYELLAGRSAFRGGTSAETFAKVLEHEPDWQALPPETPARVRDLLRRCLQKDVDRRPRDMSGARIELDNALTSRMPTRRSSTGSRPRTPRRRPVRALAVLPLVNFSGDPGQEYFADGMTEALISGLAKLRVLRIISRTSAMRYKGSDKSIPEIAKELKVDAVVEGSVFREGKRVRISAQLIDAVTDSHLWAESYERDLESVLLLQSEIARAIVREVHASTTPEETERPSSVRLVNAEAYDAYLKGRYHWYKLSEQGLNTAEQYFRFALEKDPNCARAFAGIAEVWMMRGDAGFLPPRQVAPAARAAVLRALELDGTLVEAHICSANLTALCDRDWPSAEQQFQRAIQLNPSSAEAHLFYSDLLISVKRPAESMAERRQALELDPLNSFLRCFSAWHLVYERRYDEAIGQLRQVLAAEPDFSSAHMGLWGALYRKGSDEAALAEAKKFFAVLNDKEIVEALDRGYAEAGYHGAMKLAAEKLAARSERTYVPAVRIARLYAHAGEADRAMHWLEEAYEHRESPLLHLSVGWDWDCLRDDPRFQNLLRRMNLPQ